MCLSPYTTIKSPRLKITTLKGESFSMLVNALFSLAIAINAEIRPTNKATKLIGKPNCSPNIIPNTSTKSKIKHISTIKIEGKLESIRLKDKYFGSLDPKNSQKIASVATNTKA